MKNIKRISTGIPGLDKLMQGGFIKGSAILVAGSTGTGKTIFSCQFIWEGLKNGENCLYVTMEESPEDIIEDVKSFGWDFESYVKKGKLIIEYSDPFEITDITSRLVEKIKEKKIQRVVIDSTSLFGIYFKDPFDIRKQLYKLIKALKSANVTSVLTAEIPEATKQLSRFGVEEYLVDGVIVLQYLGIGEGTFNSIQVRKMRRTNHNKDIHQLEFTERGLVVKK